MSRLHTIVTHPGGAHKDDFLACSILVALHGAPVVRRDPTAGELADPRVAVVDIGHEHAPDRSNFDHHQFARDHEPTCSLSLVLKHLGLYEDARQFCDWLEPAEWFDSRGMIATAKWMGVSRDVMDGLTSPIDVTLLRRFARGERWAGGDPIYEIMRMIGEDFLEYLKTLRERLDFIAEHSEIWNLERGEETCRVLFMPRTEPLPVEPSLGLERFIQAREMEKEIVGLVYPDRRGPGHGLSRYHDNARLDFTRITDYPDVHFAHARGFVAKTSATESERLKELVVAAWVD